MFNAKFDSRKSRQVTRGHRSPKMEKNNIQLDVKSTRTIRMTVVLITMNKLQSHIDDVDHVLIKLSLQVK